MRPVRVDNLLDLRFYILGQLLGCTHKHAYGEMLYIWEYCTDHKIYVLDRETIFKITKIKKFPEFLIKCELGEEVEDGIRIKGTKGRI
jgi:hypothetical protein